MLLKIRPIAYSHYAVIKWKHFPHYWPFVRGTPSQRPVTQRFDIFFDLCLSKQTGRWWFETPSRSSWCHCNVPRRLQICWYSIAKSVIAMFLININSDYRNQACYPRILRNPRGIWLWLATTHIYAKMEKVPELPNYSFHRPGHICASRICVKATDVQLMGSCFWKPWTRG